MPDGIQELIALITAIPSGAVTNYGSLGRALTHPVSGLIVGRWMNSIKEPVPWWRVVGADGKLPIWKKDPQLELTQIELLRSEGIEVIDGRVDMTRFGREVE